MDATTRSKIDAIWQGMWNNGMADPKINITQITYLLFIKMLDDNQIKKEKMRMPFMLKLINLHLKKVSIKLPKMKMAM